MESKPTRVNEDFVQPQVQPQAQPQFQPQVQSQAQPQVQSQAQPQLPVQQQVQPKVQQQPQPAASPQFAQVPITRNLGQPVNQNIITRRPSVTYTGENIVRVPAPPPILQRIDSRSAISQPTQPIQPQQYQTVQQNRPIQQPTGQQPPQQQPKPRLVQQLSQQQFQPPKQPLHPQQQPQAQQVHQQQPPLQVQNHQQQVAYQQRPPGPQYQQPRPELVTRRPSVQLIQGPLISQQNRPLAPANQYQQPGQQGHLNPVHQAPQQIQQQNRPIAPTQAQVQHLNSVQNPQIKAGVPQGYSRSPTPQGQASTQQQLNQPYSGPTDVNRVNPTQYRVPNPHQAQPVRPGNPSISNNLARLQEERRKMSAEINSVPEIKQPSYIISNSDDVDDVIVRPISQSSIQSNQSDNSPKIQPPQPQAPRTQPAPVDSNRPNYQSSVLRNITAEQNVPPSGVGRVPLERNENVPVARQAPTNKPPEPPTPAARKSAEDTSRKQNGTSAKATEKVAEEPGSRTTSHSRASSHKSQEDLPQRSSSRSRLFKIEKPEEPVKKVPMNKVKVGNAPPPNLKQVRSKIGSLDNATHKPGGGKIKIETKKLEFNVQPRIEAKNQAYAPKGGERKIISTKLQWNAQSKVGSLDNANHKPGGGDKKILTVKTNFSENAKPKVGSKDNTTTSNGAASVSSETAKP